MLSERPEEPPSDEGPSEPLEERKVPTLRAEVFVLADRDCGSKIESAMPGEVPVRTFSNPGEYVGELSGNVAVALLSVAVSEDRLLRVVKRTITASEHARIALFAQGNVELLECDVPSDETFVTPVDREEFEETIQRLYVRAYYSVTLDRFYRIALAIRNRELKLSAAEQEEDDRLRRLRDSIELMRAYLVKFRGFLGPDDREAMANREDRLEALADAAKAGDPAAAGLPSACPDCSIAWDEWHGPRLRNGYKRIGADAWRCTRCGSVMANMDPSGYQIG
ncbi:MAG: hypothetical protein ABEJ40_04315 [Haloarculaceae archaeon]